LVLYIIAAVWFHCYVLQQYGFTIMFLKQQLVAAGVTKVKWCWGKLIAIPTIIKFYFWLDAT